MKTLKMFKTEFVLISGFGIFLLGLSTLMSCGPTYPAVVDNGDNNDEVPIEDTTEPPVVDAGVVLPVLDGVEVVLPTAEGLSVEDGGDLDAGVSDNNDAGTFTQVDDAGSKPSHKKHGHPHDRHGKGPFCYKMPFESKTKWCEP